MTAGFTLVELMVVVAIIGILATVGAISLDRSFQNARARDSAIAVAGVFRAAVASAQSSGQVVMLRVAPALDGAFISISPAPRVGGADPMDVDVPVANSCKLISDYGDAYDKPHDGSPRRVFGKGDLVNARVNVVTSGPFGGPPVVYCIAPDGRVYDDQRQPLSQAYGSCTGRGIMVGLTTAEATLPILSAPSELGGPAVNLACERIVNAGVTAANFRTFRTRKVRVDAEREWHNLYMVELGHNGTVKVEN